MSTSRHLWTRDLLERLDAQAGIMVPGTLENVVALIAQMQAEGGAARFNPLNTTLRMPGSTDYNSVRVQNFVSYAQGLDATVRTLRQTNMHLLLAALERGDSTLAYWTALGMSPWGTHPPGGLTIVAFIADVRRHWTQRAFVPIAGT